MATRQTTYWSQVWLQFLQNRPEQENQRLAKGKSYKRRDHIKNIEVSPGLIRVDIEDRKGQTFVAQIGIECFSDPEWEELFATIMEQTGLSTAILAGEVPEELTQTLLSVKDTVSLDCNCGDNSNLCKHIADSCWAVADLFDQDPFMILLFRGQDREKTLSRIRAQRSVTNSSHTPNQTLDSPRGIDTGTSAAKAYGASLQTEPVRTKRLPRQPGTLLKLAFSPPQDSGIEEAELRELVSDAARRAYALVAGNQSSQLHLDEQTDSIRRAANGDIKKISKRTKISEEELANLTQAWRFGQEEGVWITQNIWDPAKPLLQPGREAIQKELGRAGRINQNRISAQGIQIRLDKQNKWWKFTADDQLGWVLCSHACTDPVDLFIKD